MSLNIELASPKTEKLKTFRELPTQANENLVYSSFVNKGSNALESLREQAKLITAIFNGTAKFTRSVNEDPYRDPASSFMYSLQKNFSIDHPEINYDKIAKDTLNDDIWLTLTNSIQTQKSRFKEIREEYKECDYLTVNDDGVKINARNFYFGSKNEEEFKEHYKEFVALKEYVREMYSDRLENRSWCDKNCTIL